MSNISSLEIQEYLEAKKKFQEKKFLLQKRIFDLASDFIEITNTVSFLMKTIFRF